MQADLAQRDRREDGTELSLTPAGIGRWAAGRGGALSLTHTGHRLDVVQLGEDLGRAVERAPARRHDDDGLTGPSDEVLLVGHSST